MIDKLIVCRNKIDNIDKQIMQLFEERMNVVLEVAQYKKENNIAIFNKEREDIIMEKNINRLNNKEISKYAEEMLQCLIEVSKQYQESKLI